MIVFKQLLGSFYGIDRCTGKTSSVCDLGKNRGEDVCGSSRPDESVSHESWLWKVEHLALCQVWPDQATTTTAAQMVMRAD